MYEGNPGEIDFGSSYEPPKNVCIFMHGQLFRSIFTAKKCECWLTVRGRRSVLSLDIQVLYKMQFMLFGDL